MKFGNLHPMNIILWDKGSENGPHDAEKLRKSIHAGEISPKILARLETGKDWKPLEMLLPKQAMPQTPAAEPVRPTPTAARPINLGARVLGYVLMVVSVGLFVVGGLATKPDLSESKVINEYLGIAVNALTARATVTQSQEVGRLALANGDRATAVRYAEKVREDFELIKRFDSLAKEVSELKAAREQRKVLYLSIGGVLLLLGVIIRVYS